MTAISQTRAKASPLRALFESAGAKFVELPVLHPAEPFLETAGEDIRRRMFVTEGPTGERLALRPDFTIPVCLEHLRSGSGARRYAYEGLVFRRHDSGSPERLETGFEDIGAADEAKADAGTLALAISAAQAFAGGGALTARLGDIGLFTALLEALALPPAWQRRLRRSFGVPALMDENLSRLSAPRSGKVARVEAEIQRAADRHDRNRLVRLIAAKRGVQGHGEGQGRSAEEIADRFLDQSALAEARIEAAALKVLRDFLALDADLGRAHGALRSFSASHRIDLGPALDRFAARVSEIAALRPKAPIRFEARFGRPLDYYTGLVFEVRAEGIPFPVTGGGRYDRLMQLLGAPKPIPAVGFTMRLDIPRREPRP
jgi:ATP phosphoribosyltransferase regulatory subunit